jgi:hypothetical protein
MTDARSVIRGLLVYSLCLPLAIVLGYMLATPLDPASFLTVGLVLALLLTPILLRWHHPLLVFFWNATAVVFFLPGRPPIWMFLAAVSLLLTSLQFALNRQMKPQYVPGIARPLILLAGVIVVTAMLRGGIGLRVFGSEIGGARRYIFLLAAIAGYFALSARRIPVAKANLYVGLFFLGSLTQAIGSLSVFAPPALHFIFLIFPVEIMPGAAIAAAEVSGLRVYGAAVAGMTGVFYMLARYQIRGLLNASHPGRLAVLLGFLTVALLGGYRSFVVLILLVFAVQFYLEGLFRTKLLPLVTITVLLTAAIVIPLSDRLPYQFQRALSVLPVRVDPAVAMDTKASTDWRIQLWKRVLPEVPQYLVLGKGCALNLREYDFLREYRFRRGEEAPAEMSGDYHNGPLSVIVPFGLPGVIALVWFWVAGGRWLLRQYRYGVPELRPANTLLLALFVARAFYFLVVFGGFPYELVHFTGIVALSVALNGTGAQVQPAVVEKPRPTPRRPRPLPGPLPPPAPARG